MKKIYYLSTCNTCMRIIAELNLSNEFLLQNIKIESITKVCLVNVQDYIKYLI